MNTHSVILRFANSIISIKVRLHMNIAKAAVLGAGTMGAGIAAHLANAGIPTLLLDIAPSELTPDEQAKGLTPDSPQVRERVVRALFDASKKLKPAAYMLADNARL